MTTFEMQSVLQRVLARLEISLASGNGLPANLTDELSTPEENLARRFLTRRNLTPPIDVEAIAKEFGEVATKRFPVAIDGLCLDIGVPGVRPKIWVSDRLYRQRRRFTLAHEIGHVLIPWHMGSIVDDLDASNGAERSDYYRMEGEANRFAAELLMPTEWVRRICDEVGHMRAAMQTVVEVADVSLSAGALRIVSLGPPGYVVAAVRDGRVEWSSRTNGTRVRPPPQGRAQEELGTNACALPEVLDYGTTTYYWWKAKEGETPPPMPTRPWREILNEVVEMVPTEARHGTRQRLNAIIGYSIGKLPKGSPVEELYQRSLEGLMNRSDENEHLQQAMKHPEFMSYVLARVYDRAKT